jgi:hypothetical protein
MRTFYLTVVSICIAKALSGAEATPTGQPLSPGLLRQDVQLLHKSLVEAHPGVYRYTSARELDDAFDNAMKRVSRPLTAIEFYRLLAPVVAMVKCGHTTLKPPDALREQLGNTTPLVPVDVEIIEGRAYVSRDYGHAGITGSEILSINGVSIHRILDALLAATSRDGNVATSRTWRIGRGRSFAVGLYTLLGVESPFKVVYRLPGERRHRSASFVGISQPVRELASRANYPQDQTAGRMATIEFTDAGRVALLTIRSFAQFADLDPESGVGSLRMADFFTAAFREMAERKTESLVLDLRDNTGGQGALGAKLFSFLTDQPFDYYDDLSIQNITFSFASNMRNPKPVPSNQVEIQGDGKYHWVKYPVRGLQQPSICSFAGRLFVMMNGGSFSTTSEILSLLHYHRRATFIGEEPGGTYFGNTSGFSAGLVLPYSKLSIEIPLTTFALAVRNNPRMDRGVLPDYPITRTSRDLLDGADKALETALRLARE